MKLLIAGEGSRDRVWGPVFTRGPVQFRQKNKKNYITNTLGLGLMWWGGRGGGGGGLIEVK